MASRITTKVTLGPAEMSLLREGSMRGYVLPSQLEAQAVQKLIRVGLLEYFGGGDRVATNASIDAFYRAAAPLLEYLQPGSTVEIKGITINGIEYEILIKSEQPGKMVFGPAKLLHW